MLFRIHKRIPNYLVVLPLLETSPSQVSPVLGTVTSNQDPGPSTSLPDPPSFSYRHCSPCDFGRGGTASGRSHLSQTSRRTECRNLTGGKTTCVSEIRSVSNAQSVSYGKAFWSSRWITGKNKVTSCSFTRPYIPQGSLWNLSTVTHSLVENKG